MNEVEKFELLRLILNYFNPPIYNERERVVRILNKISIYVHNETNAQHSRPHAHIQISHKYGQSDIGRIWIDTFETELKDKNIDNKQLKSLNEWLKNNKQVLIDTWAKNNNVIEIDF